MRWRRFKVLTLGLLNKDSRVSRHFAPDDDKPTDEQPTEEDE